MEFAPGVILRCERVTTYDHKGKPITTVKGTELRLDGGKIRYEFRSVYFVDDEPVIEVWCPKTTNIRQVRPQRVKTTTGRTYEPVKEAS